MLRLMVMDTAGNLYGTTNKGGMGSDLTGSWRDELNGSRGGTVFMLTPS